MQLLMPVPIFLICLVYVNGQVDYFGDLDGHYNRIKSHFQKTNQNPNDTWEKFVERQNTTIVDNLKQGQEFLCTEALEPSRTVPLSVHELRPADIKVIAALGDSVTAGFGLAATSVINLPVEWRGRSWTSGVEKTMEDLVSVASVLEKYNPGLIGTSTGNGGANSANAGFNVANSGAIGRGIPGQVRTLINKMKSDPSIDYANDWKLVSLWIGGNDLCTCCRGNDVHHPDRYAAYIKEALDELRDSMPRTFVNLIQIVDVTKLYDVQEDDCLFWHSIVCGCGTNEDKTVRDFVTEYARLYQESFDKLAHEYDALTDFTVVTQPFFVDTEIPEVGGKPDRSFFSIDCFHYTEKAHDASAVALWNNMFEPVGEKNTTAWSPGEPIICPTDRNPYLFTSQNSKSVREQ